MILTNFLRRWLSLALLIMLCAGGVPRPAAADGLDFGIESLVMDPAEWYENTRVRLQVRVKNMGTTPVDGAQIVVNFSTRRTDGQAGAARQFQGTSSSPSRVEPGGVVTLSSELYQATSMAAGAYEVTATLSLGGSVSTNQDSNAANNTATLAFQVQAGRAPGTNGDLNITGYRLNDQGTRHDLVVDLANQGTDGLTCPWHVPLKAKITQGARTVFEGEQNVYGAGTTMAPGAAQQFTFQVVDRDSNARLADSTYRLSLSAWRDTSICQETTFDNNFKNEDLIVGTGAASPPPPVDFAVESLALDPSTVYENTRVRLQVRVKNMGTTPVDGAQIVVNFSTRRTDGQAGAARQFQGTSSSPSRVEPGGVVTLSSELYQATSMAAGVYEVTATLSLGGSVSTNQDSNAANNTATLAFQVQAGRAPGTNGDLNITGYRLNDQGTRHDLVVDLANQGTDGLTCPWHVPLKAKITQGARTVFEGEQNVYGAGTTMAPGAAQQFTFQVVDRDSNSRLADGTYRLSLSAWRDTTICQETTFDNNFKNEDITVNSSGSPVTPTPVAASPTAFPTGVMTAAPRLQWDFAVRGIAVAPKEVVEGTAFALQVTVANTGPKVTRPFELVLDFPARTNTRLTELLNERRMKLRQSETLSLQGAAGGQTFTISVPMPALPAGEYEVMTVLNVRGLGREADVSNNRGNVRFIVRPVRGKHLRPQPL